MLGINCIELQPVHEFNELEYYQASQKFPLLKLVALSLCKSRAVRVSYQGVRVCVPYVMQIIPGTDEYRYNYWGYSTVGFFAPMARFSAASAAGKPGADIVNEFKTLVKECHRRGVEVILDVVFNHTAEGNENGPTLSFRCGDTLHIFCCVTHAPST